MAESRTPLDANAFALMLALTTAWGVQQVVVKITAPDISLVMQAGLRSVLATGLLFGWARWRGTPLFARDGTLRPGIWAGLLFAAEFGFIYAGLGHTNASRMSVFVYLAPALTAVGLHLFVPGERLAPLQWLGVGAASAGIVVAFGDGFSSGAPTLMGDLCGMAAAALWAATIVIIRATPLAAASATKTLFYQLAIAAAVLPLASVLLGEKGVVALTPWALASLVYQGAVVAFVTFLVWFWLLTRYLAAPLSVLAFLTPMFGVLAGVVFLSEPLTGGFVVAAMLVGAGIVLVNLRR